MIVDPAPAPFFTDQLPQDYNVTCDNVPQNFPSLNYSNSALGNCLISGSVPPIQSGSYGLCGGSIILNWDFTDQCGNTLQHQQVITVDPAPLASFINPPIAETVACDDVLTVPPLLSYSNNAAGVCAIDGVVPAIQSGSYDECGGILTYTWVFVDDCNRSILHTQQITVDPAPDPVFVNPPPDLNVLCGQDFPPPGPLVYTNNLQGPCQIQGSVSAVVTQISPTQLEYTWTYINICNFQTITHTQVLTEDLAPEIQIDPVEITVCEQESFDLATIVVTDVNNTNPTITYHSGTPAFPGNELSSTIVNPPVTTTYYILAFNQSGCLDEAPFQIIVEPPPTAGNDGAATLCFTAASGVNLFDYLGGNPDPNGTWTDPGNTGVNISNPQNVNFQGSPPGIYTFDYTVLSLGACPNSTASVELEILPEIILEVLNVACLNNLLFYEVYVNTGGSVLNTNVGTIIDLGGNEYQITDIPIGESLIINGSNVGHPECSLDINVSPPNCNCPTVNPPVGNDESICEGETTPELSVTVGVGETANWYDAPVGGTLLLAGSTTYTPPATIAGVYQFYVETEDIVTGCVSLVLTQIELEIFNNPTGLDAQLVECDTDDDGFVEFDLTVAQPLISANPYTYAFYETQLDAENETSPLATIYTNITTPTQDLFVVMTNQDGCTEIVTLALLVNLPPVIDLLISPEGCLGDEDGSVTINTQGGINYSLDGANWTTQNIFNDLPAGTYTAYVEDANLCLSNLDFTIDPGMELNLNAFSSTCNNNGTSSDPDDDFYEISFTIGNTIGAIGTYTLNDGTSDIGTYNYNESNTIIIPALGQSLSFYLY